MSGQDPAPVPSPRLLHDTAWAEAWELIDLQLSPLGLRAIEALGPGPGEVVIDIGSGAGQTVLQLADGVGQDGRVIGVDLAPLLLDIARDRTRHLGRVHLIEADAACLDLPAGSADAVYSRFGVMGFDDAVAAFSNFRRILKPGGRLAFVCWRALEDNELDHLPLLAAGFAQPVDGRPFSFADPEHIRQTLETSGFGDIAIDPHDAPVSSGDLEAMTRVLMKIGPLGKIIRETPALQAIAEPRLRAALSALGDPAQVSLRAAVWIVSARA